LSEKKDDISVISVRNDDAEYGYIWQRDLFDRDKFLLGIVGQLPPLSTIRELIQASSPELLQIDGFNLMKEIENSII
jgi:hypothetical protein